MTGKIVSDGGIRGPGDARSGYWSWHCEAGSAKRRTLLEGLAFSRRRKNI